jgi:hypothetical protein
MSEFVQGIGVGIILALGAGALALYLGRVMNGGDRVAPPAPPAPPGTVLDPAAAPTRPLSPRERRG